MTETCVIYLCPWDSGTANVRFGTAPKFISESASINRLLTQRFSSVKKVTIDTQVDIPPIETATTFRLIQNLSERVSEQSPHFPILLSGNCIFSTGVLAGLFPTMAVEKLGLVWFDAHADFNTPDTSVSGFICGTSVSLICGQCFHQQAARIPGFHSLSEKNIILAGVRDIDVPEQKRLDNSNLLRLGVDEFSPDRQYLNHCEKLFLHFDMDVLDPNVAKANEMQPDDGLQLKQITDFVSHPTIKPRIAGITFASIDPSLDGDRIINCIAAILAEI